MNERIKEIMFQSGLGYMSSAHPILVEKFAELIVRECKENFAKVWYEQGVDCRGAELDKFMTRFDQHFGVEE
jgi:hypothetical protein